MAATTPQEIEVAFNCALITFMTRASFEPGYVRSANKFGGSNKQDAIEYYALRLREMFPNLHVPEVPTLQDIVSISASVHTPHVSIKHIEFYISYCYFIHERELQAEFERILAAELHRQRLLVV
jgi:hypothetical protein